MRVLQAGQDLNKMDIRPDPDHPTSGVIAVMSASEVARWTAVWESLDSTHKPPGTERVKVVTYDVTDGRNQALHYAKAVGAEWCWLIDDDQSWEADTLLALLEIDADLVFPITLQRYPPFLPIVFTEASWTGESGMHFLTLDRQAGTQEVASTGGGCLLVRKKVWETLEPPWFESGQVIKGKHAEDTFFCLRAKEAGLKLVVDFEHTTRHWIACSVEPWRGPDGVWKTRVCLYERPFVDLPAAHEIAPGQYRLGRKR